MKSEVERCKALVLGADSGHDDAAAEDKLGGVGGGGHGGGQRVEQEGADPKPGEERRAVPGGLAQTPVSQNMENKWWRESVNGHHVSALLGARSTFVESKLVVRFRQHVKIVS